MRPVSLLSKWSLAASLKELLKQALPGPQWCHLLHVALLCIAITGSGHTKLLGKQTEPGHHKSYLLTVSHQWSDQGHCWLCPGEPVAQAQGEANAEANEELEQVFK